MIFEASFNIKLSPLFLQEITVHSGIVQRDKGQVYYQHKTFTQSRIKQVNILHLWAVTGDKSPDLICTAQGRI